ncbi:MAG TPA: hypothetical protein VG454_15655, partial [Gemmatimonadales bacterium]|nr:hypothetical protein [Gemmatimonadales bacterium]
MSKASQVLAVSLALLAGAASPRPTTDISVSFVEYRVLKEIGQVRLTTGFVHDPELQKKMMANLQSFDRDGIILIAGDS